LQARRCVAADDPRSESTGAQSPHFAGRKADTNRGDKTAIELFLAGVRGWESVLQRRLDGTKPEKI
jgi:hypothetical protein